MAEVRKLRLETRNAFWQIMVSSRPDGYRCEFYGTTPKYAQAVSPGEAVPTMADMGRGVSLGKDIETLVKEARTSIEAIDGPIEREL
jgi:hypothetical protein